MGNKLTSGKRRTPSKKHPWKAHGRIAPTIPGIADYFEVRIHVLKHEKRPKITNKI